MNREEYFQTSPSKVSGKIQKAIASATAAALESFCDQEPEFEQTIEQSDISKTYEVHARIHSYEKAAEFEQIIDVQYGELKHYEMITHSNYQWDCDCPLIGG